MATSNIGKALQVVDTRNPKDIIIAGLEMKIAEQGNLRRAFDITSDYPSRETYETDLTQDNVVKRRIVVRKISNTVNTYAIGNIVGGMLDPTTGEVEDIFGWADQYTMEISVWSPDSKDRDNIVELVKLWMLELEQDIQAGYLQVPFMYAKEMYALRFVREYEGENHVLVRNGTIYIGNIVYDFVAPFYYKSEDAIVNYKYQLIENLKEANLTINIQP